MLVSYKKTTVQTVTREIPEHFSSDGSLSGRVVDVLLGPPNRKTERTRRDELFDDDEAVVEAAIRDLTEAYEMAEKIVAIFRPRP